MLLFNFYKLQTQELLDLCKKRQLLVSGGSDYHGLNSPGIEIGIGKGNLCIDDLIVKKWARILY